VVLPTAVFTVGLAATFTSTVDIRTTVRWAITSIATTDRYDTGTGSPVPVRFADLPSDGALKLGDRGAGQRWPMRSAWCDVQAENRPICGVIRLPSG
jgi:hypothetical protein